MGWGLGTVRFNKKHGGWYSLMSDVLRTFALIVSAHPYCARKSTCHAMHGARALSAKMNNDRPDGPLFSFDWI